MNIINTLYNKYNAEKMDLELEYKHTSNLDRRNEIEQRVGKLTDMMDALRRCYSFED